MGHHFGCEEADAYGRLFPRRRCAVLSLYELYGFPTVTIIDYSQLLRVIEVKASISLFSYVPKRLWGHPQSRSRNEAQAINKVIQTQLARELLQIFICYILHGMLGVFLLVCYHP